MASSPECSSQAEAKALSSGPETLEEEHSVVAGQDISNWVTLREFSPPALARTQAASCNISASSI